MKTFLSVLLAATLAGAAGYYFGHGGGATATVEKKPLFHQCPMHPWVKSDKPGNCTICGMALVPVFDSAGSFDKASADLVLLPEGAPNVSGIRVEPVAPAPLRRTLRVSGKIDDDASRRRVLAAYVGGRIEKLHVNYEGAEVKAGQPLAAFYSRELNARIAEYRVLARGGAAGDLRSLRMRLRQDGLADAQIDGLADRGEEVFTVDLLAPVSGTVVKREAFEGMYVAEGATLFELADFSTMWFLFDAYEQDLPWIEPGQKVTVHTASQPGRTFEGKVTFIDPNVKDMMRAAKVRVELPNPLVGSGESARRLLLFGLYGEAEVETVAPEVLSVPRTAVIWPGGRPRVYVEEAAGSYRRVPVVLGRPGDDRWEILGGLERGQKVVVSGAVMLDGQAQLNGQAGALAATGDAAAKAALAGPAEPGLTAFLKAVAGLSGVLATDDLAGWNRLVHALPAAPPEMRGVKMPGHAADLKAARLAFVPLSQAAAELVIEHDGDGLRVFRCPMTGELDPSVPNNARWIQGPDGPLRNPYFGNAMPECGEEIKTNH